MSALTEIQQNPSLYTNSRTRGVTSTNVTDALHTIAPLFWAWYRQNPDRKVFSVKWGFLSKTLYVRDLHAVFELLFGPES